MNKSIITCYFNVCKESNLNCNYFIYIIGIQSSMHDIRSYSPDPKSGRRPYNHNAYQDSEVCMKHSTHLTDHNLILLME